MTNKLKEEFYNKFKYDKPDYDEIADFWLSKIEEVIESIPEGIRLNPVEHFKSTTDIKQQLRLKYLDK